MNDRKTAFDIISRVLAITKYDIEQHQIINDQSLNIHGENYFRDILNFIHQWELENTNFKSSNSHCIDLIEREKKIAIQITTTRSKKKIENTFRAIRKLKLNDYEIRIYFLLEKANLKKETIKYFLTKYSIENIQRYLYDYTNLIKEIENLETNKLIELCFKYFEIHQTKYTNEIVLNLICKHILCNSKVVKKDYDDDFGSLDTNNKLILNKINDRISAEINKGLDYATTMNKVNQDNLLTKLEELVVNDFYRDILLDELKSKNLKKELISKRIRELHDLAKKDEVDFNKILSKLHLRIEDCYDVRDFNSMSVSWVIISYFFEICDLGVASK